MFAAPFLVPSSHVRLAPLEKVLCLLLFALCLCLSLRTAQFNAVVLWRVHLFLTSPTISLGKISWQVKLLKGRRPIRPFQFLLYVKQMLNKIKDTIEALFSTTSAAANIFL